MSRPLPKEHCPRKSWSRVLSLKPPPLNPSCDPCKLSCNCPDSEVTHHTRKGQKRRKDFETDTMRDTTRDRDGSLTRQTNPSTPPRPEGLEDPRLGVPSDSYQVVVVGVEGRPRTRSPSKSSHDWGIQIPELISVHYPSLIFVPITPNLPPFYLRNHTHLPRLSLLSPPSTPV